MKPHLRPIDDSVNTLPAPNTNAELLEISTQLGNKLEKFGYPVALFSANVMAQATGYLDLLTDDNLAAISLDNRNLWELAPAALGVFVVNFALLSVASLIFLMCSHYWREIDMRIFKEILLRAASLAIISAVVANNGILIGNLVPLASAWIVKFLVVFGFVGAVTLPVRGLLACLPRIGGMAKLFAPQGEEIKTALLDTLAFTIRKLPPDVLSATAMVNFNSYAWENLVERSALGALLDALLTGTVSVICFAAVKATMAVTPSVYHYIGNLLASSGYAWHSTMGFSLLNRRHDAAQAI